MYRLVVAQLDQTAERIHLDENAWHRLRMRQRAYVVSFPLRRDDYATVENSASHAVLPGSRCGSARVAARDIRPIAPCAVGRDRCTPRGPFPPVVPRGGSHALSP